VFSVAIRDVLRAPRPLRLSEPRRDAAPEDRRAAMTDAMCDSEDALEPVLVYANYLRTCEMLGIKSVPRDGAADLIVERSAAIERAGKSLH
jgi:hypothetical protein